ncbi:MAG: peptidyl-Lys metalloendopeptidase [Arenicella sp.]|jgi:peptidyl-Lys metalloendopeptidase
MHRVILNQQNIWARTVQVSVKLLLSTIVALAFAANAQAVLPAGINASVIPSQASYAANDTISVDVAYTNETSLPIKVLRWNTALEGGINDDFLTIKHAGTKLAYTGRHIKRATPSAADYAVIQPGKTMTETVDVSDGYSLYAQGEYTLAYRASRGVNLKTEVQQFSLSQARAVVVFKRPANFSSCSASEQSQINQALSVAESISLTARDDLSATPISKRPVAERYVKWFGSYSLDRWDTVQRNFDKIYEATASKTIGFDCDCPDSFSNDYAFVTPSAPYFITLCGAFWSAPVSGTNSRAGTIVHEISHFNVVAGTDDDAYGKQDTSDLAVSNPDEAVDNADNYEYFSENTPVLSMPGPADLVIDSSSASPSSPIVSRAVTISGTIANQGDDESPSTSLILSLLGVSSSPQIEQIAIPTIDQGADFNFRLVFEAPSMAGEYAAELCVSAVDGESNTNNNCSSGLSSLIVKDRPIVVAPIIGLILND